MKQFKDMTQTDWAILKAKRVVANHALVLFGTALLATPLVLLVAYQGGYFKF